MIKMMLIAVVTGSVDKHMPYLANNNFTYLGIGNSREKFLIPKNYKLLQFDKTNAV